jgi:DNA replication licensing factor MCM6
MMDIDGISSPAAFRSSLPPSSAPVPSFSIHGRSPRRIADALAIGDEEDNQNEDATSKRRRKIKGPTIDVPLVKDAVGESVAESFETFLKTFAQIYSIYFHL